jgi:hypothetical protein
MAGLIDSYVTSLRRELDFDRTLARRLASEVEDHLREAAEADPSWPSPEAERSALKRFGSARDIAAEFAADAIDRQARRAWVTLLVTILVTLVAMRLRIILFGGSAGPALAPLIDRYGFLSAVVIGAIGWFTCRRSLLPLLFSLVGLAASIIAGFIRAQVFVGEWSVSVLLPAFGEVALMTLLSFHVVALGRRLARTADLRRLVR